MVCFHYKYKVCVFISLSFVKMKGGALRYYARETSKQIGRGLGGILRNTFKDILPFAGGAVGKMKQAGVNYGKRKLLDYAYGEMVDQLEKQQQQQGGGMKGAKRKRKTPRQRADIFTCK